MKIDVCFSPESLEGISSFCKGDTRESIVEKIDRLVESVIRGGLMQDFDLSEELGTLFEIKRLMKYLPFSFTS